MPVATTANGLGLDSASIYDPDMNTWHAVLGRMNAGRWYPTVTVLANGDVLVVSGSIDNTVGVNSMPQVCEVGTGTWRSLTSAQMSIDLYPQMFLAPNGKVFKPGPTPTTRYLDTAGTGAWSFVATRVGPGRSYGSAVMYDPGKILVMGGGDPPTNTAEVIDLTKSSPTWRAVAPMAVARRQLNATLLPDGKVLVTGGTRYGGFNNLDPTGWVHAAELWDPATEQWTTLASSKGIPRIYHSSALLLPDGRVLSMGGNTGGSYGIFKSAAHDHVSAGHRHLRAVLLRRNARRRSNFKGHAAETFLGDPYFQHEPVHQHVELLAGHWRPQRCGSLGSRCCVPSAPSVAPPGPYLLFILNQDGSDRRSQKSSKSAVPQRGYSLALRPTVLERTLATPQS